MKRRFLFIGLVLVVLLAALMPSAALAKDERNLSKPAVTDFSGLGQVYVTAMPDPLIQGDIWRFSGEIAEGLLAQCSWDLLANSYFWSTHDSVVKVGPDGSAAGWMTGTFTLTSLVYPDSVLQGTFNGRISGNLALVPELGLFPYVSDSGSWYSTGGTGVFAGTKAWGRWSASLNFDLSLMTLTGPLNWEGKYLATNAVKPPPGKPFNPWKYSHSFKPVKPWNTNIWNRR
ncbi:MAG: hypothetical protein A2Z29_05795 [Chloroflexi bacterium RBG_16_56_11]|nr:MAG: hypothetical protein A2Z29_05795 [Chloroflexi bacterium RBG_16_56_11]